MLYGVCNFNQKNSVIETSGADAYDSALCKGETNCNELRSVENLKGVDSLGVVHSSAL